jgi:hypothetical protein
VLLDDVRLALRLTTDAFDGEVSDLVAAALADLERAGVSAEVLADGDGPGLDPLVKLAVVTYAKASWGLDNPDSERYRRSYRQIVKELALSSRHNGGDDGAL